MKEEVLYKVTYRLPYDLQFFAKEDSGGDKTEEPTTKKLQDARKEGQVARSTELITASGLVTLFVILKLFIKFIAEQLINNFHKTFLSIDKIAGEEFNIAVSHSLFRDGILSIIRTCLPIFLITAIVSFSVILFQVKWQVSGKLLQPKFSRINPISGFAKIFNKDKLVELIISIIKMALIFYIVSDALKDHWSLLVTLYDISLLQAVMLIGDTVIDLGLKISMLFLVIGVADLIYQKLKYKKDMRMSKQELKDEFKNTEGDPQVKSKIKVRMREASQRRMMQALPQADVVITNPTHLAAAIRYDKDTENAPVLIAKGADYLAQKIKEIAKENNIEIVENKPLARMLYYNVELGAEVPPELYQMTAEVLAYVYGLKNR
ncbi:MAG TPA: flagellar biosynthesis protein FlhB [Lachnospiraceae bacterium]|jgi:flagellar biosynthetic protein FlhB|nr:flagellar biosynthesis protein FlhB [Lachnospiraceae bacterium]HBY72414.1 flagellar biosynthesis protein FlhB [Lachnospiraceae bacterium]HCA69217.1 flagellar biosynthesis protein FlhB [Lachnospiraceae bacterium]HCM14219.1 flagellar biosynthesis protein FlhB [Lachnospiraceae bacterium]HCR39717.1 flagellar biosynthesis protein FlhB [Lachnospiraceae bacterium]